MPANLRTRICGFWLSARSIGLRGCIFAVAILLTQPLLNLYVRLFHPRYARFLWLDARAARALRKGDYSKAAALASDALRLAEEFVDDWNHGNVIHDGHQILGWFLCKPVTWSRQKCIF